MGIFNKEIENEAANFYIKQNGVLVDISDWQEANRVSVLISEYCNKCGKCLAGAPVISLGEVDNTFKGPGLFLVGLLEIIKKEECSLAKNFNIS